jgi:hypothetical protein
VDLRLNEGDPDLRTFCLNEGDPDLRTFCLNEGVFYVREPEESQDLGTSGICSVVYFPLVRRMVLDHFLHLAHCVKGGINCLD